MGISSVSTGRLDAAAESDGLNGHRVPSSRLELVCGSCGRRAGVPSFWRAGIVTTVMRGRELLRRCLFLSRRCATRLSRLRGCAAGDSCCRGRGRTWWRCSGGCELAPHPCGLVLVGLRSGARLEVLLQRRRLLRLDHRRSDVAQSRPLRAGSPVAGPAVAFPFMCGPSGPQGLCNRRRHPAASVLAVNHHTVGGVLPPTFNAGWERVALRADACCCRGVRGWGLLLSKACVNTRDTVPGVAQLRRIHAAGSWLGSGWGAA